ncbi:glycosyltransferase family 4 protein [Cetobacterium sp.]|uniref:glycosyltransferase family 4 protein n=1 Tax=Cetobacterium sp. TaxID=2071632 RepID=UPI003EE718AC
MNNFMKIYFDNIIFFLQKSGGGSVYWYELLERFSEIPNDVEYIEQEIFSDDKNIFRKRLKLKKILLEKKYNFNITRYLPLTLKIKEKNPFIFHSSYYRVCKSKNAINVVTVHDFTYEYYIRGIKKWVHYFQKKYAIKHSQGIICISENTKKDLLKFHPWTKDKNIKVIYNGVGSQFYKINEEIFPKLKNNILKNVIKEKYILFVGHRTNYKNFNIVVDTLKIIPNEYKLVVVGEDLNTKEQEMLKSSVGRYYHLKGLSIEELNVLYNKAFCFLYPSSYEGFGIPILESMKTGCPVITTTQSSIPEVAGDAALYINNIKKEEIRDKILLLENLKVRKEIIEKGYKQARKFSWDKTYKEINTFYNTLLKEVK